MIAYQSDNGIGVDIFEEDEEFRKVVLNLLEYKN